MTPQELQAINAKIDADPTLAAAKAEFQRNVHTAPKVGAVVANDGWRKYYQALQAAGITLPENYQPQPGTGNIQENKNTFLRDALIAAGVFTGGTLLAGALSGSGAAGAGAAGAGASAAPEAAAVGTGGALGADAGTAAALGAGATGSTVPVTGVLAGGAASGAVPAAMGAVEAAAPAVMAPAAAGKGVSSWLLGSALPVAGNLIGAAIQANAQNNATEAQQKALAEALAYEKQRDAYLTGTEANRYANLTKSLAPYSDSGSAADARMAQVLGLPAPTKQAPQTPAPTYPTPPMPGSAPAGVQAQTVTLRGPDGSTRQVPQDQQAMWISKGATVVEGPRM